MYSNFFELIKIVGKNLCKLNCLYGNVSRVLKGVGLKEQNWLEPYKNSKTNTVKVSE